MKKVFLTKDMLLDRDVAFALIKTEIVTSESVVRIKREAQIMRKLGDHKNILEIYEVGEHEGQPYFVMPFMSGGRVNDLIEKAPKHQLPIELVLKIGKCVCQGLEHAHAQGIIHRDIKPSNIFLDSKGNAQIGDFGLAIVGDMSRLTTTGKTMGTASYMSPEQVLGGEITFKSDLYSLGAMLYEMVTGQPPFLGNDIATITSQHINIPPRLPTQLRPDIPSALEAIIMQLLEKDPEYRPESSITIYNTLESIELGDTREIDSLVSSVLSGSHYRNQIFIGRENELKQLQTIYDRVTSGQGSIVSLVGDPGVGKSTLSEQLSTYARLRGGKVLHGYCYESMSMPYLPFIELIRFFLSSNQSMDLRKYLENIAIDLARILPELQNTFNVQPQPLGDPQRERYQLMQAVTSFLKIIARNKPVVLIIEDIHDADKGTLEMLMHVARSLWEIGILIICTYRDIELDRNNSLSETILNLERLPNYRQIKLANFDSSEVSRLVNAITGQQVSRSVANILHRHTEGNPLFIQEVVRNLVESKSIGREAESFNITEPILASITTPEQLRDVISKRLNYLSPECKNILSIGAVIGREFASDLIQYLINEEDTNLVDVFKEAKASMLLDEKISMGANVSYRFSHSLFRQVLYENLSALERIDLHRRVAKAIECIYDNDIENHSVQLVEHFSYSSDPNDLSKAIHYGETAAKQAENVYAYGEAVRLLDRVIDLQKLYDPDDKAKICDLLINLSNILLDVPDTSRILTSVAPIAFELANSIGDNARAVQACWAALFAIWCEQAGLGAASVQWIEWTEKAKEKAKPNTLEQSKVDLATGCTQCQESNLRLGTVLLRRALNVSRKLGDREVTTVAGTNLLQYHEAPQYTKEIEKLADELWNSRTGLRRYVSSSLLLLIGHTYLRVGKRNRADDAFNELRNLADITNDSLIELGSMAMDAVMSVIDGNLEEALQHTEEIRNLGNQLGIEIAAQVYARLASGRARIYLTGLPESSTVPNKWADSLQLAYTGENGKAINILEEAVVKRPYIGTIKDQTRMSVDTLNLEASVMVEHRQTAELLLNRLKDSISCTSGIFFPTVIARHLGAAAALLGKYEEARKYYVHGIKVCTDMRFRPELALTCYALACLLFMNYPLEMDKGMEYLDYSIKEFQDMNMQPSLKKALEHKSIYSNYS